MFKACVLFVETWPGKLCKNPSFYTERFFVSSMPAHKSVYNQVCTTFLLSLLHCLKKTFLSVSVRFYTLPTGPLTIKTIN